MNRFRMFVFDLRIERGLKPILGLKPPKFGVGPQRAPIFGFQSTSTFAKSHIFAKRIHLIPNFPTWCASELRRSAATPGSAEGKHERVADAGPRRGRAWRCRIKRSVHPLELGVREHFLRLGQLRHDAGTDGRVRVGSSSGSSPYPPSASALRCRTT